MNLSIKKILSSKATKIGLLCLLLSGCAEELPNRASDKKNTQKIQQIQKDTFLTSQITQVHPSGYTMKDLEKTGLTRLQKIIFLQHSELESGLTKVQMKDVLFFYEWFLSKSDLLQRYLDRSDPYIEFTLTEFEKSNLPKELAYLAYVESGYNPTIVSRAGASGLWQFMPKTGESYELKQDWYGDWRNDPYQSTYAAIEYLGRLYKKFGDWGLAVTSYNAGQGKISRAMKTANVKTLGDLVHKNNTLKGRTKLRRESLEYFPRFIAIKKIMTYAHELGFHVKNKLDATKHLEIVSVQNNTDLLKLTNQLGMTWEEFHAYNPALKAYVSPADRVVDINIPADKKEHFEKVTTSVFAHYNPNKKQQGLISYKTTAHDSYSALSKVTKVPMNVLKEVNENTALTAGTTIFIPKAIDNAKLETILQKRTLNQKTQKQIASAVKIHKVKPGDTLSSIAEKYKTSVKKLYQKNSGVKARSLRVGQKITVS